MRVFLIIIFTFCFCKKSISQLDRAVDRAKSFGRSSGGASGKDSIAFEHRNDAKDSINVVFKFLDSTNKQTMDSAVRDFSLYFPLSSSYQSLGNTGAAAYQLVYAPKLKPGWDAGFHAFDPYRFTIEGTKFYKTRKPFSDFSYQLASGKEQILQAHHTQTPKPNIGFGFDYRLITAPGLFINQNNTENASRIYYNYQGIRKRYSSSVILLANNIMAAQNGGILNDSSLLDPDKLGRIAIDVNLGNRSGYRPNPFQTKVNTGNIYKDATVFLRQSYDFGKHDSLQINDSTTEYLFYSKLRMQHTFKYSSYNYKYLDNISDSAVYKNWYNINLTTNVGDTLLFREKWSIISNDFSLLQFPDTKNLSQFFLAGITVENIKQKTISDINKFINVFVHGEYRNITRNKRWDILASGDFYVAGINIGDFMARASLSRYINKKWGTLRLNFNNTNRTPSFIFDNRSAFNLETANQNFKKENITVFGASAQNEFLQLSFQNFLINNYTFFKNYYEKAQQSSPINIVQITASKKIRLGKHFNLYSEAALQQLDGAAAIKLPLIYTKNTIAFEGLFFHNLNLSTGLEFRYFSPYKSYNYSPIIGQFMPQDSTIIYNKPDVNAFLHFRIKGFTGYFRLENLNTIYTRNGNFGFVDNNFSALHYPTQALNMRFGIRWWFVN